MKFLFLDIDETLMHSQRLSNCPITKLVDYEISHNQSDDSIYKNELKNLINRRNEYETEIFKTVDRRSLTSDDYHSIEKDVYKEIFFEKYSDAYTISTKEYGFKETYLCRSRPHLHDFLSSLYDDCLIYLLTHSTKEYGLKFVSSTNIDRYISGVFSREDLLCHRNGQTHNFQFSENPNECLLIDNLTPTEVSDKLQFIGHNDENISDSHFYRIPSFEWQNCDNELIKLRNVLSTNS